MAFKDNPSQPHFSAQAFPAYTPPPCDVAEDGHNEIYYSRLPQSNNHKPHPPREVAGDRCEELATLLEILGFEPTERYDYYDQALTHSSYTYELGLAPALNYERLEFLGDAVLKLVVSDYLYERFPHYREGELTKIRAVVVSDAILAKLAERIELGAYLIMGASEARSGGARKTSNLACAFEALLGAFYLDGQIEQARVLLQDLLQDIITDVDLSKTKDNYKAVLQEFTQGEGMGLPEYVTTKETGPSHNRTFHVEVRINNEVLGYGTGKTKKEAQQQAAKLGLIALNQLDEADL